MFHAHVVQVAAFRNGFRTVVPFEWAPLRIYKTLIGGKNVDAHGAQVAAFRNGFRTVVPFEWLHLFSGPEVQRLISGDNTPIDLKVYCLNFFKMINRLLSRSQRENFEHFVKQSKFLKTFNGKCGVAGALILLESASIKYQYQQGPERNNGTLIDSLGHNSLFKY